MTNREDGRKIRNEKKKDETKKRKRRIRNDANCKIRTFVNLAVETDFLLQARWREISNFT